MKWAALFDLFIKYLAAFNQWTTPLSMDTQSTVQLKWDGPISLPVLCSSFNHFGRGFTFLIVTRRFANVIKRTLLARMQVYKDPVKMEFKTTSLVLKIARIATYCSPNTPAHLKITFIMSTNEMSLWAILPVCCIADLGSFRFRNTDPYQHATSCARRKPSLESRLYFSLKVWKAFPQRSSSRKVSKKSRY